MTKQDDIFKGLGQEVTLEANSDGKFDESFYKIRETLTRVGAIGKGKQLIQSCHILHKQGRYAIMHFKEMFVMGGRESRMTEDDKTRRNNIALMLEDWGLCNVVDDSLEYGDTERKIVVISHEDKAKWTLTEKFKVGGKK